MTRARESQIDLDATPWYHVVNRCVRRAYLCGVDEISGQSYEHRRGWIEQRMMQLASVFSVDIAAFAVMSNHYHLVVRVDREKAQAWSDDEVLARWTMLFSGNPVVKRYLDAPQEADEALLDKVQEFVGLYRGRLHDVSWFMRVLNESIARMANQEDGVKGRFWEGRFKSQALLDEQAVLSVMAYVDLNPVRAKMAEGLEDSDFTSVQRRIHGQYLEPEAPKELTGLPEITTVEMQTPQQTLQNVFLNRLAEIPTAALMPFDSSGQTPCSILFSEADYLEFVDYLGRAVHPRKRGKIADKHPKIMEKLSLSDKLVDAFCEGRLLNRFGGSVGKVTSLKQQAGAGAFRKGSTLARRLFAG